MDEIKRFKEIRRELEHIQAKEQMRLFRLARKAKEHGCSHKTVEKIRCEGIDIGRLNVEDFINPFFAWNRWKYAFKW